MQTPIPHIEQVEALFGQQPLSRVWTDTRDPAQLPDLYPEVSLSAAAFAALWNAYEATAREAKWHAHQPLFVEFLRGVGLLVGEGRVVIKAGIAHCRLGAKTNDPPLAAIGIHARIRGALFRFITPELLPPQIASAGA